MATATVTSRGGRISGMSVSRQGRRDHASQDHDGRRAAERRKKVKQLESENKRLRDALDEHSEASGVRFKCQDLFDVTVRGLSADRAKELEEALRTFVETLGPSSASELLRRRLQTHASSPQVSRPQSPWRRFDMGRSQQQVYSVTHRQFPRDHSMEGLKGGRSELKYPSEQGQAADSVGFDFDDAASLDELFSVSEADIGGEAKSATKVAVQVEESITEEEEDDDDESVDLLFTARQQDPESVRAREREYDAMMAEERGRSETTTDA